MKISNMSPTDVRFPGQKASENFNSAKINSRNVSHKDNSRLSLKELTKLFFIVTLCNLTPSFNQMTKASYSPDFNHGMNSGFEPIHMPAQYPFDWSVYKFASKFEVKNELPRLQIDLPCLGQFLPCLPRNLSKS